MNTFLHSAAHATLIVAALATAACGEADRSGTAAKGQDTQAERQETLYQKAQDTHAKRQETLYQSSASGIEFVRIPAGSFTMGSPESEHGREADEVEHRVTISRPFLMGKYEVTREQWERVMQTQPWDGQRLVIEGDDLPAIYVDWPAAQRFVDRLNELEGTDAYALPTEAQWEYAARAGSSGPFPDDVDVIAWIADNSGRERFDAEAEWVDDHEVRVQRLIANENIYHPVGEKQPNAWGLYDMHGNVWEWVRDWYGPYSQQPVADPTGPEFAERRSLRGGSWSLPAHYSRSASRDSDPPDHIAPALGFRIMREIPPSDSLQHTPGTES